MPALPGFRVLRERPGPFPRQARHARDLTGATCPFEGSRRAREGGGVFCSRQGALSPFGGRSS